MDLPMWDFVLHRVDGTGVRLQPLICPSGASALELELRGLPDTTEAALDHPAVIDAPGVTMSYKMIGAAKVYHFDQRKVKRWARVVTQEARGGGASASATAASSDAFSDAVPPAFEGGKGFRSKGLLSGGARLRIRRAMSLAAAGLQ